MKRGTFDGWLDAYRRARESRDPGAAADLLTDDATYHETPFDEPADGRGGALDYRSEASRSRRDVRFSYEVLAATGGEGMARWRASFARHPSNSRRRPAREAGRRRTRTEFREWWHEREEAS